MLHHVLLLTAVVLWGWSFVATKVLVAELPPVDILALRLAIGLPFLGALLLVKRVPLRFTREDARPICLAGGIFTLHFLIQSAALMTTSATNSGWIISVTPLVLAALSFALLRERIGSGALAGIVVATIGILLLVSRGRLTDLGRLQTTGDWLMLASTVTWALYTVVTRDVTRRRHPLAVTFGILFVTGALAAVLFAAWGDVARIRALSPRAIAALVYLAIAAQGVGLWFWQEGVGRLGATRAGLYLYLEPLATLALAVPLLGEPLTAATAVGGGLVLAGVYLGQRDRRPA